jgi:hypothetical protein
MADHTGLGDDAAKGAKEPVAAELRMAMPRRLFTWFSINVPYTPAALIVAVTISSTITADLLRTGPVQSLGGLDRQPVATPQRGVGIGKPSPSPVPPTRASKPAKAPKASAPKKTRQRRP